MLGNFIRHFSILWSISFASRSLCKWWRRMLGEALVCEKCTVNREILTWNVWRGLDIENKSKIGLESNAIWSKIKPRPSNADLERLEKCSNRKQATNWSQNRCQVVQNRSKIASRARGMRLGPPYGASYERLGASWRSLGRPSWYFCIFSLIFGSQNEWIWQPSRYKKLIKIAIQIVLVFEANFGNIFDWVLNAK